MSRERKAMERLMVVAARLRRDLDAACRAHGITHDQHDVLRILKEAHPLGQPRYAIAECLPDRAPDVTRLLDRLEREGLVQRYRSEEDRRLSMSRVTDRGLALLDELEPAMLAVHERLAGGLKKKEARRLVALCDKILGASGR